MSVHVSSHVWKLPAPDPATKLILLKLADCSNDEGECWPSLSTIARDTQLCKSTICDKLNDLESAGWLRRVSGEKKSTTYQFSLPEIPQPPVRQMDTPCPPDGQAPVRQADSTSPPSGHKPSVNRQLTANEPSGALAGDSGQAPERNGDWGFGTPQTPPIPVTPLKKKKPDGFVVTSAHRAFGDLWCDRFKAFFGDKFKYTGRDAKAVKELLDDGFTAEYIVGIAERAWTRCRDDKFCSACKRAATIYDLAFNLNQIRVELANEGWRPQPKSQHIPNP